MFIQCEVIERCTIMQCGTKNLFDPPTQVTIDYVHCVLIDVLNHHYWCEKVTSGYNLVVDELINCCSW